MGLPRQGPYVPARPADPGKGLTSSLCLPWPLPPAWRPVTELPPPCRAGCRMMVVLDRTRSHESVRRWAAASESKRCPASRLPRLPAAPGSLGGGLPDSPKTFRAASADPHSHPGGLGGGWGPGLGAARRSPAPCSGRQLSLEEPVPTAVLLSLAGVGSVLVNQWPARLQDNALRASTLWESEWAPPRPLQPPDACRGPGPEGVFAPQIC